LFNIISKDCLATLKGECLVVVVVADIPGLLMYVGKSKGDELNMVSFNKQAEKRQLKNSTIGY
jgi:hypothetical protein